MNEVKLENNRYYGYDYYNNKTEFFNIREWILNKSNMPLHTLAQDNSHILYSYITRLYNKLTEYFITADAIDKFSFHIIDMYIATFLLKTSLPIKICEIGGDNGLLSWNLAEIVGKFNSNSQMCMVCNSIGNDAHNEYLDTISVCENPPEISLVISDYDNTHLQSDYFDIVVINGSVNFDNPDKVIKEAERIAKKGGMILCYSKHNTLIENTFKLFFDNYEDFYSMPDVNILKTEYNGDFWKPYEYDFLSDIKNLSDDIKLNIDSVLNTNLINIYYKQLKKLINHAVKIKDIQSKIYLIEIHERLADYKIRPDEKRKILLLESLKSN